MTAELLQELEKRAALIEAIDSVITNFYLSTLKKRLKRGEVQKDILSKLGLLRNNLLCTMISERMTLAGYECITNSGTKYYRHKEYKYTHDVLRVAKNVMKRHSDLFKKLAEND